jgi:hypothetical protein
LGVGFEGEGVDKKEEAEGMKVPRRRKMAEGLELERLRRGGWHELREAVTVEIRTSGYIRANKLPAFPAVYAQRLAGRPRWKGREGEVRTSRGERLRRSLLGMELPPNTRISSCCIYFLILPTSMLHSPTPVRKTEM